MTKGSDFKPASDQLLTLSLRFSGPLDLSAMPAVRPQFNMGIFEVCPSRDLWNHPLGVTLYEGGVTLGSFSTFPLPQVCPSRDLWNHPLGEKGYDTLMPEGGCGCVKLI